MLDRLGNPFPASENWEEGYNDASYIQQGHNVGLDTETGDIIFSPYGQPDSEIRGSIVELLSHPSFYMPSWGGKGTEEQRIRFVFHFAFLLATINMD